MKSHIFALISGNWPLFFGSFWPLAMENPASFEWTWRSDACWDLLNIDRLLLVCWWRKSCFSMDCKMSYYQVEAIVFISLFCWHLRKFSWILFTLQHYPEQRTDIWWVLVLKEQEQNLGFLKAMLLSLGYICLARVWVQSARVTVLECEDSARVRVAESLTWIVS